MVQSFTRVSLLLAVCTGLAPWSQAAAQAADPNLNIQNGRNAAVKTGTTRAKVCDTRGMRSHAGVSSTWTITVSSSGGSCGHARQPAGRSSNLTYVIATPPQHGQITQTPTSQITYIVYTPTPGYKGPDGFVLHEPSGAGINLAYTVNVVP